MKVEDFEEVGREFLITLNMSSDKEIMKQTMDLFTFKDQQISNTQVLMEDLQKRIKFDGPFEMKIPQFLITGNNFRQNERPTNLLIKKDSIQFTHKSTIQEENENNTNSSINIVNHNSTNSVVLPKVLTISQSAKKQYGYTTEGNQHQHQNESDYLTDRIQTLQQVKHQKSLEYQQIHEANNNIANKNIHNETPQLENNISFGQKKDNDQKPKNENETIIESLQNRDYQSYNFLKQQLSQSASRQISQRNITSEGNNIGRINSQDTYQSQVIKNIQNNGLKNIINITALGLNSPSKQSIKNIHNKQSSFEFKELNYNSERQDSNNNQTHQRSQINLTTSQNNNLAQQNNQALSNFIQSGQQEQQLVLKESRENEQNNSKRVSVSLLSPQKRVVNSIHLSSINMPLINPNQSTNANNQGAQTLSILDEQKTSGRNHLNLLPHIDHFATVSDVDSLSKSRKDSNNVKYRDYNISLVHGNTASSFIGQNDTPEQVQLPRFDGSKKNNSKKSMVISSSSNSISRKVLDTSIIIVQQQQQKSYLNPQCLPQTNGVQHSFQTSPVEFATIFLNQTQQGSSQHKNNGGNLLKQQNISSIESQFRSYDSPHLINNSYSNQQQYLLKVAAISSHSSNPLNRMQHHQQHYFKKNRTNIQLTNPPNANPQSMKQFNSVGMMKSEHDLQESPDKFNNLIAIQQIPLVQQSNQSKKISNQLIDFDSVQSTLSKNSKISVQTPSKSQSVVLQPPFLSSIVDKKKKNSKQLELLPEYPFNLNSNVNTRYHNASTSTKNPVTKPLFSNNEKKLENISKLPNTMAQQTPILSKIDSKTDKNLSVENNLAIIKLPLTSNSNSITQQIKSLQPIKVNEIQKQLNIETKQSTINVNQQQQTS